MLRRLLQLLPFRRQLTRDRFARWMVKRLRNVNGIESVEYQADSFRLQINGEQYLSLVNFYDEHCRLNKSERETHFRNVLQGIAQSNFELPADFEDARHDLLPKVWPRAAFDILRLQAQVDGRPSNDFAFTELGPHLYLGLVFDLPKSVRSIRADELQQWGLSLPEALEIACENLKSRPMSMGKIGPRDSEPDLDESDDELPFTLPKEYTGEDTDTAPQPASVKPDGSVYLVLTGDSYDATRMVLLSDFPEINVAGQRVAIAPNRDTLLIAGSNDPEALATLATIATEVYGSEPRPHVPIPIVLNEDGQWAEFRVAAGHPAYDKLHALEVNYLAEEYNEQKPLLEKLYEKQHLATITNRPDAAPVSIDSVPFVASLLVAESEEGRFESHAVWAEHLDTLLPKADVVAFMKQSGNTAPIQIPWADVMAVLDDLVTEVPDHYPPRYQVREFPSDLALRILTESDA